MMSILVPGEHMPLLDHNSLVFTPPCSIISLPAYKHDYPNFVVFSDRNTRQSADKVHSDQVTVEPQDYTAEA